MDAFMLEMQQLVDEQKKEPQDQGKPRKADLEDEEDNVADFMEVHTVHTPPQTVAVWWS